MNDKFLEEAQAAAEACDLAYRKADIAGKLQLKAGRDKAFELAAKARRLLVAGQVTVTEADVAEMRGIRSAISGAADTQSRLLAFGMLAVALAKHVA